ncbi:MAG: nicotinate-nucleotide adenylyltransferase [Candidatus Sericytochromatia bacterium]
MKKIGILGGTFNPIHIGHLIIAQQCKEQLKLDQIIFIPNGNPPHKNKNIIDKHHRFKMLSLAIEDNKYFDISDIEIKKEEPSYTINTILELKKDNNNELFFIMGDDSLFSIIKWYKYTNLIEECKFIVFPREKTLDIEIYNQFISNELKTDINKFSFISFPIINVSSTLIREMIEKKISIKYLVPDKVINYIDSNKLYLL